MSIGSALETALSGLTATQAQIQVISGNIANVQTPGYSRETLPQETVVTSVANSVVGVTFLSFGGYLSLVVNVPWIVSPFDEIDLM